jgi:hypothetical protein
VVLLLLAMVWAVVLVPGFLRRRAERGSVGSVDAFQRQLRVLRRAAPGREVPDEEPLELAAGEHEVAALGHVASRWPSGLRIGPRGLPVVSSRPVVGRPSLRLVGPPLASDPDGRAGAPSSGHRAGEGPMPIASKPRRARHAAAQPILVAPGRLAGREGRARSGPSRIAGPVGVHASADEPLAADAPPVGGPARLAAYARRGAPRPRQYAALRADPFFAPRAVRRRRRVAAALGASSLGFVLIGAAASAVGVLVLGLLLVAATVGYGVLLVGARRAAEARVAGCRSGSGHVEPDEEDPEERGQSGRAAGRGAGFAGGGGAGLFDRRGAGLVGEEEAPELVPAPEARSAGWP